MFWGCLQGKHRFFAYPWWQLGWIEFPSGSLMHFSTFFLLLVFLWKESETILVLSLFFTEASLCSRHPELYKEMPWSESMSPIFLGHQIFLDVFLNYFIDDFIPSVFSLLLVFFFFCLEHLLFKCWSISCNFVFFLYFICFLNFIFSSFNSF